MNRTSLPEPLLILILGALCTISPFAIDMYLAAFPQIATALGTTSARLALTLSSYFVGMSLGQIAYGPLLDRYGRKPPLVAGLTIFILASVACTQVPSVEVLIGLRFVQALGGCVAGVAAMAMVRDFFPVSESARVFSLLMLVLSASPLLAPTCGGFVATHLGWRWIFLLLAAIVAVTMAVVIFVLPEGHAPDPGVSLRPGPLLASFRAVLNERDFRAYALAGAFSFAGLFAYVAGSPAIFLEEFRVTPAFYGAIFAFLAVAVIGGSQLNLLLMRRYSGRSIFRMAIVAQCVFGTLFLAGVLLGGLGLYGTIGSFLAILSCVGLVNPNASALALAPFTRNVGTAASLMGFLQIGAGALATAGIGLFGTGGVKATAILLAVSAWVAWFILNSTLRVTAPAVVPEA